MVQLARPIGDQIRDIETYFVAPLVFHRDNEFAVKWRPVAAGKKFEVCTFCDLSQLNTLYERYDPTIVTNKVFFPELALLTDYEFYHIPHTWLSKVLNRKQQIEYMIRHASPPPLMERGCINVCAYERAYLSTYGVDFFDIMKLVASYLHMLENWRCGFGWHGEGASHARNLNDEAILRKALRRHHLSSSSSAALAV